MFFYLGGTSDSQREFLETLSLDPSDPRLPNERKRTNVPPIANQFALGYTYQDVLDADHEGMIPNIFFVDTQGIVILEGLLVKNSALRMTFNVDATDILARVSVYLLSEPSRSFAPLLRPLLTPASIPETLIVILLDWSTPWTWVRQLREWVRLLRSVLISLNDETKCVMEEVMTEWRDRKRGLEASAGTGITVSGGSVTIPLGPGEWDEGLGIPMCVICQGVGVVAAQYLLCLLIP